jgi:hypothetical protein
MSAGSGPGKIDARFVDQLAHLLETEIGFTARKILGNAHAGRRLFRLVLHLVGYPKAVEQAPDIDATAPVEYATAPAESSAFLTASPELMSGLGEPALTAMPTRQTGD